MMYGDLIMNVANQVRPYEVNPGDTAAHVDHWTTELLDRFDKGDGMSRKKMRGIFDEICADFKSIPVSGEEKIRVGVVGEIYIKFSSLGNNQLEQFLLDEGAEPVVPGLTDFMIFKIYNRVVRRGHVRRQQAQAAALPVLHGLHRKMPAGHDRRPEARPVSAPPAPLPSCTSSSTAT